MLFLGVALTIFTASAAQAHGENAQESWLRMNTVAFWNVNFSTDTVKQGESVTITGTAKVLNTWPQNLKPPGTAYISVVAPGPVFLTKDRVVNGQAAPDSFYVQKGSVYNFSLTIVGRVPGRYSASPGRSTASRSSPSSSGWSGCRTGSCRSRPSAGWPSPASSRSMTTAATRSG